MKWNLKLLYKSPEDPQIEADIVELERLVESFSHEYDTPEKSYLTDPKILAKALQTYEDMSGKGSKALLYFNFVKDLDATNVKAASFLSLLSTRLARVSNKVTFFVVSLGTISAAKKKEFLSLPELSHFKVFLGRIFDDAKHMLSVSEEKIIKLKSLPGYEMWLDGNDRVLGGLTVKWKGKTIPLPQAQKFMHAGTTKDRRALDKLITEKIKTIAPFSEAEINAVYTNKKIDDELRKYETPFQETVETSYRNDPEVVKNLVKVVTDAFPISQRFYKIKAKLLKEKVLVYADRMADVGKIKTKFTFDKSLEITRKTLAGVDWKYVTILNDFIKNGQIDVMPKVGKKGGAYCWGSYETPSFVLLNHTDDFNSLSTLAHEMGHAFHTELSRAQSPLYMEYSFSLAETASTLFEAIVSESVLETLPEKEQILALHDKIQDRVSTVFRQVACFNFELDLHNAIRAKGFVPKEEIAELHNKNMKSYLGPVFKLVQDDGYFFVQWGHIRRFFYVYSYAYGQLVSSALLRRYKQDKRFWKSIEQFLSAGGKASPEEILKEIGIDVSKPEFWMEGIKEIEEDIVKLEKLVGKKVGKK